LVDQADECVRAYRWVAAFEPARVKCKALLVVEIGQICRIGLIRPIFSERLWHPPHGHGLLAVGSPLRESPMAQVVFVVEEKLLQTCAGYIYQSHLWFT